MADTFVIESSEAGATLELSALDSNFFLARVTHGGLDATARVGSYLSTGLGDFFASLAADWKGWEGARRWESLEGELSLAAESDRTGHVDLLVHLHNGAPVRWKLDLHLTLEAGQLERIVGGARRFERSAISAS
jgi:hypothetical protein